MNEREAVEVRHFEELGLIVNGLGKGRMVINGESRWEWGGGCRGAWFLKIPLRAWVRGYSITDTGFQKKKKKKKPSTGQFPGPPGPQRGKRFGI